MSQVLSQDEVDALLKGISGGEIETVEEVEEDLEGIRSYDLTSQDRITRGRMPTLEMTNEKFARMFRTTLSSLLRKVVNVTSLSVNVVKFGEFMKTLPVPTSLHVFRMNPLRGSAIIIVESKVIFALVDMLFGGTGQSPYKIEGREFTAIENSLIKKVVLSALADLEKAWMALLDIKITYQRSEINPQFAQIVPPTDVVVVVDFEIEMEYSTGTISLCFPYSTLEPIRDKLQAGFQSEQLEVDRTWANRFKKNLMDANVALRVELGRAAVSAKGVVELDKGDVILLNRYAADPLDIFVGGILKFRGHPGTYKGNQAVQVSEIME
ncbi:MAG: flagellar motor switch protein FliM [Proteobacteria bacterium]|nr:flagellar motor switch protein FliM [Pseudomonadota bacterium]